MTVPFVQVDAFTDRAYAGNPAAVCVLDVPRDATWMQAIASEMNLSETAFLRARDDGGWSLRWFTPTVEVELCGHATLASAHALWEDGVAAGPVAFHTRSGVLGASQLDGWIVLDFPAQPPVPVDVPDGLASALGSEPTWVGRAHAGFVVELADERAVRDLTPDMGALRGLPSSVIATAAASRGEYDFVSRYFAPGYGIDEDPVTGSAHCALGPHWAGRLGRDELTGFQASARGGIVRVRCRGDRVDLSGRAVTTIRGEILST